MNSDTAVAAAAKGRPVTCDRVSLYHSHPTVTKRMKSTAAVPAAARKRSTAELRASRRNMLPLGAEGPEGTADADVDTDCTGDLVDGVGGRGVVRVLRLVPSDLRLVTCDRRGSDTVCLVKAGLLAAQDVTVKEPPVPCNVTGKRHWGIVAVEELPVQCPVSVGKRDWGGREEGTRTMD